MVQFFDSLSDSLRDWALNQQVFFVASAARFGKHVNVSPKGLPASTFTVLDPNTACYIDATGSGAETIAHLYETKRATIMFCSFDKSPRIMRFFCTGEVIEFDQPRYHDLLKKMGKDHVDGARAVILLHIFKVSEIACFARESSADNHQVQTSCGYGVPWLKELDDLEARNEGHRAKLEDRKTLGHWASKQVEDGAMEKYRAKNNARSLDNTAGLAAARRTNGELLWFEDMKLYLRRVSQQWDAVLIGVLIAFAIMLIGGELPAIKQGLLAYAGIV